MQTIQIYVSKLSKKILLKEYQQTPIHLRKGDVVYDYLRTIRIHNDGLKTRTLEWLSEPVQIVVYDALAMFTRRNNSNVGVALFNYHRQKMLEYVEALEETGMTAKAAIELFFKKYDITEDDYSFETAARRYRFFKRDRKNSGIFGTNRARAASHFSDIVLRKNDDLLVQKANDIATRFYPTSACFRKHLTWYLLYTIGRYSVRTVASKTAAKRNTVFNGIQSVKSRLLSDAALKKAVHN